jgi:hypothetical protein
MVTTASVTSTKDPEVTNAAVTSDGLPVIAIALVTVTVPVVAPPIALSSAAVIPVPSASLKVTVASLTSTKDEAVTNAAVN